MGLSILMLFTVLMTGCNKRVNIPCDAPDYEKVIAVLEESGYVKKSLDDYEFEDIDDTLDRYYVVFDEIPESEQNEKDSNEITAKVIRAYYMGKEILNACYYTNEAEAKRIFLEAAVTYSDIDMDGSVLVEMPEGHGHIIYDGYAGFGGSDGLIAVYGTKYYSGNAIVTVGNEYYEGFLDEVNDLVEAFGLEGPLEVVDSNLYK